MRTAGILLLAALLASCAGTLNVSEIRDGFELVLAQHDAYVEADGAMEESAKAQALAESSALEAYLETHGEAKRAELEPLMLPVLDRFDAYVRGDTTMPAYKAERWLRLTQAQRAAIAEVRQ